MSVRRSSKLPGSFELEKAGCMMYGREGRGLHIRYYVALNVYL